MDLILLHRHPLQHLCGIIVTTIARHISLLLNSHRRSDSHHYTLPKILSYHHFLVIVPSASMQITSARATPYHRARRAVQARAAPNHHRAPTHMSLPQYKYQRTHPRQTSARAAIPSRPPPHQRAQCARVHILSQHPLTLTHEALMFYSNLYLLRFPKCMLSCALNSVKKTNHGAS